MFYLIKNKKNNVFFLKFFFFYNFFLFFIFNYNDIKTYDTVFIFICYCIILYFSNKITFFLLIAIIFIKIDNLIINLILTEIFNIIFFVSCKKNFNKLKNIIIYNFIVSTIYIFFVLLFFQNNYGTLNKEILFLLEPAYLQYFLLSFIFVKMGGIFGYFFQINYY